MLKTRQSLEIYYLVLQETVILRTMVDVVVCRLPLLRENDILLNGILDHIGRCQYLLLMLLGVSLDMMDLSRMGSPLHLSIIHL